MVALTVQNLIGSHLGVVYRNVCTLYKSYSIKFCSAIECTLQDILQLEIRCNYLVI